MIDNVIENPIDNRSEIGETIPPTDQELRRFLYRVVIAAILIPPSVGGLVATTAGFYPFPEFFFGLADTIGVFVAAVLTIALLSVPRMHRVIVGLANDGDPVSTEVSAKTLYRFNASIWLGLCFYTIIGGIVSDLYVERIGYKEYQLFDHILTQIAVFPVVLLSSFPIFFVFFDGIGRYLAPRGVMPLAVSLRTKVLVLGIFSPLLIDSVLVGFYYNQTGYFSLRTVGLWSMLLIAASIGAYLAWRSIRQGLRPLQKFTQRRACLELGTYHEEIKPASLDELGILTDNLNLLEKHRLQLTTEMRDEREYSNTLLRTMANVVVVLFPDGRIDYVNPAFEKLSGRLLADVKGEDWFKTFIPETDRVEITKVLKEAVHVPTLNAKVNPIIAKDGTLVDIEWSDSQIFDQEGNVVKIIATGVDVSRRLDALRKLENSERSLRAAERIAGLGNWHLTGDGKITFSEGALEILGAQNDKQAWNQTDFLSLVHPDDYGIAKNTIETSEENSTPARCICRISRLDGKERFVRLETGGRPNDQGTVSQTLGIIQDITQISITEEKLRQAQKMEAVGNLTGGVAHDFNNLLAVILGNLELLRDELEDGDQTTLVDAGIVATLRGADLTKNMLSFARQAHLKATVVAMNDVVRETQKWIGRTIPSSITVETSLLAGLWKIEADCASIESALLNLVLNARDAMPQGGKLTIETANVRIDEDYLETRSENIEPGRYVMLAVSDTGQGIDAKTKERVFEPFFTTKPPGSGSGLGLSMVEGFMKQSGGAVQIYSEPGEGTTVKLYFSALAGVETAQDAELVLPARTKTGTSRILLAEDENAVREVLVAGLEKFGFQVTAVMTGDAALQVFQQDPDFDILVTDIVMPGKLQGTTLSKALREIRSDLPVVFMSGYASEAIVHGNGLRPEDIRLMKPVRQKDLFEAIGKALLGVS